MPPIRHHWDDIVLVHWRRDPGELAGFLPHGVRPDVIDGSAWVGLVAYTFRDTTIPPLPPPPFDLGTLTEVTVEILTVDDAGRHGVAYRTIETDHLFAIAAARIGIGVPYRPARVGRRIDGPVLEYRSRRVAVPSIRSGGTARPRPAAHLRATTVGDPVPAIATELASRDGIHVRHLGTTCFWERRHAPLDLRAATLDRLDGSLDAACGLPGMFATEPDSALAATRVEVEYAWGGRVLPVSAARSDGR